MGFFGNGMVGGCKEIVEECQEICEDRYSEDHECVHSADGQKFTCKCKGDLVQNPNDIKNCMEPGEGKCEIDAECFRPYLDYGKNMTDEEMAERVMCVDGECRCTFLYPFIDSYGCCVKK